MRYPTIILNYRKCLINWSKIYECCVAKGQDQIPPQENTLNRAGFETNAFFKLRHQINRHEVRRR